VDAERRAEKGGVQFCRPAELLTNEWRPTATASLHFEAVKQVEKRLHVDLLEGRHDLCVRIRFEPEGAERPSHSFLAELAGGSLGDARAEADQQDIRPSERGEEIGRSLLAGKTAGRSSS
jgi:hypothetical protein